MNDRTAYLRPGERLGFRLAWGPFTDAGRLVIHTRALAAADDTIHVEVQAASRGAVAALHRWRHRTVTHVERATARIRRIEANGRATTEIDLTAGLVHHHEPAKPARSGTFPLPAEVLFDLPTAMLHARTWATRVGDVRRGVVLLDGAPRVVEFVAEREERVDLAAPLPAATALAVTVRPIPSAHASPLPPGPSLMFWISRGDTPQLVRLALRGRFGAVTGTLMEVTMDGPR